MVSKELKNSTRKLCRQLQDNPDVGGNQKLIKQYKLDLINMMMELMEEQAENQQFIKFKEDVDKGLQRQEEFNMLKEHEKELNTEIKEINENLKKKQDEFAKEA